jgi:S1-C subfamily serine protease
MTVDEHIIDKMELSQDQQGVLVLSIEAGSLVDTAGLRAGTEQDTHGGQTINLGGDIINAINGQEIASSSELKAALAQLMTDQELQLSLLRDGKVIEINIFPNS